MPCSALQDEFLGTLCRKQSLVAVYLKNGIKLKGTISGFDNDTILLAPPSQQVIYKSAVSTVAPLISLAMCEENL